MLKRNLVLGSVASIALACAAAAPSYAQSQPGYSTPAEMAETNALNAQQAAEPGIIVTPGTTVVAANDASSAVADYHSALAAQSSSQSQYDSQLNDYQQKRSAFDQKQQDYQQKLDAYNRQMSTYRDRATTYQDHTAIYNSAVNALDAPVADRWVTIYPRGHERLIVVEDVLNPDNAIAGAPVEDRTGYMVGHFSHLTFQDGGREKAVIALNNNKTIAVNDDHLRYDPANNLVIADLSFDELNSMPARF